MQRNGTISAAERRGHVLRWSKSEKTQKAYCAENNLKYSTFCSWVANEKDKENELEGGFVPVVEKPGSFPRLEISLGEVVVKIY